MFADDTMVQKSGKILSNITTVIQHDIDAASRWFRQNRLKGELTKKFLFLFSLDQVSLVSLLKYFPPKMSLT